MFEDALRNVAFALVRSSGYVAGALLFGLAIVSFVVLRPALRDGGTPATRRVSTLVAHRVANVVDASLIAAAAATLLALLLQSLLFADLSGGGVSARDLGSVVDSSFGVWRAVRLPLLLALGILLTGSVRSRIFRDGAPSSPGLWWWAWFALAGLLLLTNPLSGHAAVSTPAALAVVNDWVHLAAGAVWFAGIVTLAALLPSATRPLGAEERLRLLAPTVIRFSRLALVAISAVGVTGTANAFFHLESFSDLFDSGYGRAVAAKIVLFVAILVLGGVNHLYVRSRLAAALAERRPTRAQGLFRRTIAVELTLGIAVLVVTGFLVGSARTRQVTSLGQAAPQNHAAHDAG